VAIVVTPRGTRGTEMPPLPRPVMGFISAVSVGVYRLLGARLKIGGVPLLLLTTVGARSGAARRTLVADFVESDGTHLIVASAGGSAKHPAWYFNVARHPDQVWIEVNKQTLRVEPQALTGGEREIAWQSVVARSPGFASYAQKTDREIPVLRLVPVPSA
jgi:deazaflavin-dependent oxidoreductase (nitroreductase family)